jgi:SAM-dependent methyltransferase
MRCVPIRARYDSYACWYDERLLSFVERARPLLTAWLGPGPGRCLELGCGGGVHLPPLTAAGWFVVGLDLSADQLGIARRRRQIKGLVRGDIACLPFADGSFDAAFAAFIQTDVDDWSGTAAEAAQLCGAAAASCASVSTPALSGRSRVTGESRPHNCFRDIGGRSGRT